MKSRTNFAILFLALIGLAPIAQAALVIDYNPGATTFNRALTTDTPSVKEVSFNTTTPFFNGSTVGGLKL